MLRESLVPGSREAIMLASQDHVEMLSRSATDGPTINSTTYGPTPPQWLRLVRSGNTFSGYYSSDGVTWTLQTSVTIAMGTTIYVGLALTSHNNSLLNTSTFDNVSIDAVNGPPRATSNTPAGVVSTPISSIDILFDRPMDTSSFSIPADVASFTGPGGNLLSQINSFSWINATTLRLNFTAQVQAGAYSLALGPQILSANGTPMDQDGDGLPGEVPDDRYTAVFTIRPGIHLAWATTTVVANSSSFALAHASATAPDGSSVVVGEFGGTCTFGPNDTRTSNFSRDIFIAKYSNTGTLIWVQTIGGTFESDSTGRWLSTQPEMSSLAATSPTPWISIRVQEITQAPRVARALMRSYSNSLPQAIMFGTSHSTDHKAKRFERSQLTPPAKSPSPAILAEPSILIRARERHYAVPPADRTPL